jgi:hypothetical protein
MIRFACLSTHTRINSEGEPFTVYREEPSVPRIDNRFLDCSIYLYGTEEMARSGESHGGSGFLAAIKGCDEGWMLDGRCPQRGFHHCYAVTNKHVAWKSPVVRLNKEKTNTAAARTSVFPFCTDDWTLSDDHDLAVVPIDFVTGLKYLFIDTTRILTEEKSAMHDIGIGDDVFMVGRFINHEGKLQNNPSIRWGHIGMMPVDVPDDPDSPTSLERCFVIETHSIAGYSGSPVFVRPFPSPKLLPRYAAASLNTDVYVSVPPFPAPSPYPYQELPTGPWLLGIEKDFIHQKDKQGIKSNTGMSSVVPAWHLLELLNTDKLLAQRIEEQKQLLARLEAEGATDT